MVPPKTPRDASIKLPSGGEMVSLTLPPVPDGENAYLWWALWLRRVFESQPTPGFHARLCVLWTLSGFGVVASILYLLTLFLESRTRETSFWFWRSIYRPSGRYLVGNQRTLFALFSLISCGIFIGYFLSFDRIYLQGENLSDAFVWRSIIWLPIGTHLWVSSWANLQATIIASQTAVGRQLLGPTLATTLYLAGIILGTLSITGLAIACSIYWTRTWRAQERLEYALLDWAFLRADDLPEVARQTVEPLLEVLNSWLGQFTMRVMPNFFRDPSVRSRLTIVHALHRQIKYATSSSSRARTRRRSYVRPVRRFHIIGAIASSQKNLNARRRQSLSVDVGLGAEVREAAAGQQRRTITDASSLSNPHEHIPASEMRVDLSSGALRRIALDSSPINSAARQKAMRLLELRKVERDVLALLVVIVLMASMCLGIALWIAAAPTSVYSNWTTIEVAYFVVPWMYLCSVDAALTFLLFNSLRHLAPVRRNAQSVVEANVPLPAAQAMAQVPILYRSQEHTNGASPHCTEEADGDGGRSSSESESSEEEVQTPTSDDVVICLEPSAKV
ncbi:hypothetical protein C6P46_004235 [Rhodotorula mucilaginosa]|uniref:Proteophosphoglycan ppg4 n=1 Tax=Rhodotorula mucilaginosa TaxID=5537 RepID=A0A9P7B5I7_RHOMI|nr:hypothetical protein C6P46_004235 [Rhodotorula mucilaginosa]